MFEKLLQHGQVFCFKPEKQKKKKKEVILPIMCSSFGSYIISQQS